MAESSKIEWTEATWNIITGCDIESPGCINCYAMLLAGSRLRNHPSRLGLTKQAANGKHVWTGEVRFNEAWLDQPLRWSRPRCIFVCAHGDLFHPSVPDEWIDKVFAVMARARHHTYQVLTKRAERMCEYMNTENRKYRILEAAAKTELCAMDDIPWPLPQVHIGVSVEDQQRADERVPFLIRTPAAVRWLSIEPLIGMVHLDTDWLEREAFAHTKNCNNKHCALDGGLYDCEGQVEHYPAIDWVVVGGESGAKARPMHPDWVRLLRDQCVYARVPFFFKQWGTWAPGECASFTPATITPQAVTYFDGQWNTAWDDWVTEADCGPIMYAVGKKKSGRLLDGRTWDEVPA